MEIDHISLSTTPVLLQKGDTALCQGTGFFYIHEDVGFQIVYLVTNYHVLTGFSPSEEEPPMGDNIVLQLHLSADDPGKIKTVRLPLFAKNGKSLWITSSTFPAADIGGCAILS